MNQHDHHHHHGGQACSHGHAPTEAIAIAEARCAAEGLRLTPMRRDVLSRLASSPRPLGAYDLVHDFSRGDRRVAPITVYRALDFLVEAGFAHRIQSRNAYVACGHGHRAADLVVFMICETCDCVVEGSSDSLGTDLGRIAAGAGFRPRAQVIEMFGRCAHCGETPGA